MFLCFFFKQKTAYEMRISDWSSDVCSSDLGAGGIVGRFHGAVGHARKPSDAPRPWQCTLRRAGDGHPWTTATEIPVRVERSRDTVKACVTDGCLDFARHERKLGCLTATPPGDTGAPFRRAPRRCPARGATAALGGLEGGRGGGGGGR